MENLESEFWRDWENVSNKLMRARGLHTEWLLALHCVLLCANPSEENRRLARMDSSRCAFGRFVRENLKNFERETRDGGFYHDLMEWHEALHEKAGKLCDDRDDERRISVEEYGAFNQFVLEFQKEMDALLFGLKSYAGGIDALTGIMNRKAMKNILLSEQERAKRSGYECCVAMIDIDFFKKINDKHGHVFGDEILVLLVECIRDNIRAYDWVFRYGGEEFLVCMPRTNMEEARTILERIRRGVESLVVALKSRGEVSFTVSIGCSPMSLDEDILRSIRRADDEMYRAKSGGRNRLCSCQ